MENSIFARVNEYFTVPILKSYIEADNGSQFNDNGHLNPCPFCGANDSFYLFQNSNACWSCRSCGKSGDILKYMQLKGKSVNEAANMLVAEYQIPTYTVEGDRQPVFEWLYRQKHKRIDPQAFKDFFQNIRQFPAEFSLPLRSDIKFDDYFAPSIVIPVYSACTTEMIGYQLIKLDGKPFDGIKGNKRFASRKTGASVVNGWYPIVKDSGDIILVESFSNACAVYAAGFSSICAFSAGGAKRILPEVINKYPRREIILGLDVDKYTSQQKLCKDFDVRAVWFPLDSIGENPKFDWNDLIIKKGDEYIVAVKDLIASAAKVCPYAINSLPADEKKKKDTVGKESPHRPDWLEISDKGRWSVIPGPAAIDFVNRQEGNLIYAKEAVWQYSGGYWQEQSDKQAKSSIQKMICQEQPKACKKNAVEDIFFQATNKILRPDDFEFDQQSNLICLKNCVIDTQSGQELTHNKNYYQSIQLPFAFNPDARCPRWEQFLTEVILDELYEDQQNTIGRLQEWFGYCLVPTACIEKCLYLFGEGQNGKGVFLKVLSAILGNHVAAVEPSVMFEDFRLIDLLGKLVNICTDICVKKVLSEEFKKIVSGEKVTAGRKFKPSFTFSPFAKHLFSANAFIPTKDRSYGFYRRFDVLEFRRQFSTEERDENLLCFIAQNELPGIFNWALRGLGRLVKNRWKMTESKDFDSGMEDFRRESNPVEQFVDDCCSITIDRDEYVDTRALRLVYTSWCEENGYKPLTQSHLGRELKRLGHDSIQVRIGGNSRKRKYSGLKLIVG